MFSTWLQVTQYLKTEMVHWNVQSLRLERCSPWASRTETCFVEMTTKCWKHCWICEWSLLHHRASSPAGRNQDDDQGHLRGVPCFDSFLLVVQGQAGGSEEESLAKWWGGNLLTQMDTVACSALQTSYTNCVLAAAEEGGKEDHINTQLAALQPLSLRCWVVTANNYEADFIQYAHSKCFTSITKRNHPAKIPNIYIRSLEDNKNKW